MNSKSIRSISIVENKPRTSSSNIASPQYNASVYAKRTSRRPLESISQVKACGWNFPQIIGLENQFPESRTYGSFSDYKNIKSSFGPSSSARNNAEDLSELCQFKLKDLQYDTLSHHYETLCKQFDTITLKLDQISDVLANLKLESGKLKDPLPTRDIICTEICEYIRNMPELSNESDQELCKVIKSILDENLGRKELKQTGESCSRGSVVKDKESVFLQKVCNDKIPYKSNGPFSGFSEKSNPSSDHRLSRDSFCSMDNLMRLQKPPNSPTNEARRQLRMSLRDVARGSESSSRQALKKAKRSILGQRNLHASFVLPQSSKLSTSSNPKPPNSPFALQAANMAFSESPTRA